MTMTGMPRSAASPESMSDDPHMVPVIIIPFQVKRIIVIHPVRLKAIVPCVIVGRKIVRRQRAGIGAVGGLGLRINLLIFRLVRLVKVPVARRKRGSDQHKLNVFGLFHNGVAGLTATIKIL
jgi:hypothetical protein